jgi:branched-chain amino acid transport system substrate-binding protein
VWVIDGKNGLLRKIDPAYGVAGSVRVAAPNPAYDVSRESFDSTSVAAGAGSVWVTTGTRRLVRVDPRTSRVVDRIDLRSPLNGVAAGADAVWAISGASATAIRLDGRGRVTVRIPIVSRPGFESPYPLMVRLGEGFVWVLNANTATVTKIDPEQRTVSATIPIGIDRGPARLAVGAGAAWVANGDGTLSRIDPSSNAVTTIRVGHRLKDVAVGGGNAWVTTGTGLSGNESATVTGGRVRALPTSSCSPIYFEGRGRPQYLIASDLPLQGNGTLVPQLSQAIQLVLRQHRFRAGPYAVGYQSCDDSTAPEGFMSEARCGANARAYARDTGVIGVIGAFNSGCSAVELPILNRAANGPLAMISPTNTVVGLTRAGPGTAPGEPGRYYPTGIRNYARIAATDNVQAAADAIQVRQLGARKISVLYEPYGYGRGLAAAFASAAAKLGLTVVARQSFQYDLPRYTPLVTQVERAHPDAVLIAGVASTSTVEMIKELRVALGPGVKIMATDGFSDLDLLLKLAGAAAEGMTVSAPGVPNEQLPAKGRQFVAAFGKTRLRS